MKGIFAFTPLVAALVLAGCGGGGSSGGGGSANNGGGSSGTALKGAAVKGPLANAAVSLYAADPNQPDGLGELLDRGDTNGSAAFSGVSVPDGTTGTVIVEVVADADTIDLTTGQAPVISRLLSVSTAEGIANGQTNYPTPLSTLALQLALKNADSPDGGFAGNDDGNVSQDEWLQALGIAQQKVKSALGFDLLGDDVDLFSSPPLITSADDDQAKVVQLRTAVEAVSALAAELAKKAKEANTASEESADSIFSALLQDFSDGTIDGQSDGQALNAFSDIPNLATEVTQDPSMLVIPGTDGVTVGQTNTVVAGETADTGQSGVDTSTASATTADPAPAKVESDLDGDGEPDSTDPDIDGDGVLNADDPAPGNPDRDDDGVVDGDDAFPDDAEETADTDGDGVGDNSDAFPEDETETVDSDGDGVGDNADVFPNDPEETADTDGDGVGDNADAFPEDETETVDSDGDGVGDNADVFPNDPEETADTD
ncbi:hypothetical protein, partial [uncultured Alcanivorax sp.]